MTNVFVLFPFPQPSDTNGCWKRSKMKNLSWTQTALLRLGCLSLIWETEKIQFGVCVCSVCVCVESPPYNCSSLQVRWSYALLRRIVWGDICLSQWSSGIFGGHEINCSSEQTLDQQMNKFYPQAPTIAASRAEQSRLSSLLSLRCQLGDYWVDLIPLIRISSDTTRRMATFKSDI